MLVTDPAIASDVTQWVVHLHDIEPLPLESETVGKVLGALLVLVIGKAIAVRAGKSAAASQ